MGNYATIFSWLNSESEIEALRLHLRLDGGLRRNFLRGSYVVRSRRVERADGVEIAANSGSRSRDRKSGGADSGVDAQNTQGEKVK